MLTGRLLEHHRQVRGIGLDVFPAELPQEWDASEEAGDAGGPLEPADAGTP